MPRGFRHRKDCRCGTCKAIAAAPKRRNKRRRPVRKGGRR